MRARLLLLALLATPALALETQVLPKGTWSVDLGYTRSSLDKMWNGQRQGVSLLEDVMRYEPGGGLQGILHARPSAQFHVAMLQLMYGLTDRLSVGLYLPLVVQTSVDTNLSWTPGDYQPQLGRAYSEADFWAWAGSMGQPRPAAHWVGNRFTMADSIAAARYLLPESKWMAEHHLRWSGTLTVGLPTGKNADPEEAVSAGTNLWELHSVGDVEGHLSADKLFFVDEAGVSRFSVGADVFGSWFRPRVYTAGTGAKNPLLTNSAPYVGATYVIDPGDWLGASVSVDIAPFLGPTRASRVSQGSEEKARALPPLVTLSLGYTYVATGQSRWYTDSPLWSWDREKLWQPGEKHIFKATLTVSLLRLGAPVQLYVGYRAQDLVPGRFTRSADVFTAGVRTLLKFW